MTTIHLTDAQRDTFAACGLVVVEAADAEQWSGVVTLTATCPDWRCTRDWHCGCGLGVRHVVDCGRPAPPCPSGCITGVVTLGRFTIHALLPVVDCLPCSRPDWPAVEVWHAYCWVWLDPQNSEGYDFAVNLDPVPRPGQFIARPERVV